MPQPLSRVHPTLGVHLATGNTPHTPDMAASVLAVINLWAQIDYNYSSLLASIGEADPITVTAVFQAMVNGEARKTALLAATKAKLAPEQAALIVAAVESNKASRETRNEFAHHLWGSLNTRSDCVVLVNPKTVAKNTAAMIAWRPDQQSRPPELDRSEIMVWTQADFNSAVEAARVAHNRVAQLSHTFNHPAADHRRARLLADPQIQRLYNHYLREIAP